MKRVGITVAAMLLAPCVAFADGASRDISGVYVGQAGTVTIMKGNVRIVKLKPAYVNKYYQPAGTEYAVMADKAGKVKKELDDTGKELHNGYLVSFDMGKNKDCSLKWKNLAGEFDGDSLLYKDVDKGPFFRFHVDGDDGL